MTRHTGSAAVASKGRPTSAVAAAVARCAERMELAAALAKSAALGPEPLDGAEYLLDTVRDLSDELRLLRSALRRRK